MNQLNIQERAKIVSCLVEGCSMLSTGRLTGFSRKGVCRTMTETAKACVAYHDKIMRNLKCQTIQVDEIWTFTYCKQANIPEHFKDTGDVGDTWTWIAIDADTKLVPSWHCGDRSLSSATLFLYDLQSRLANRVQLTSDGYRPYLEAVEAAFGNEIDYAMLIKMFGKQQGFEGRYSPPKCTGIRRRTVSGQPSHERVSTSFVERQNLTMRMNNRRFTRLTNAFSKNIENHKHMLAITFMHYNFCRIHKTLRVTPAMEAGISDHVWSVEEITALK
jgi:IS1 family transposase